MVKIATFAGETLLIIHKATYDKTPLTSADVGVVSVTIYNALDAVVVASTPMTWDAAKLRWQYSWNTAALTAGSYQIKVGVVGLNDEVNFEFKRVVLKTSWV